MTRANYTLDLVTKTGPCVDARAYGGDLTHTTINLAIAGIGADHRVLLITPGIWVVGGVITVPANITLKFDHGAVLSNAASIVTINGPIEAPPVQIFSGAGTFVFGDLTDFVYAEWWGVDGTADDVQINAALVASNCVRLLPKRYYTTSAILMNSNNKLAGAGRELTFIDWQGAAATLGKIMILAKNNVIVSSLTIDSQTNDAALGTGVGAGNTGITIDDNSFNILLEHLHIHDSGYVGIVVNSGSEIRMEDIKISYGCYSCAILIGQWPVSVSYPYSTGDGLHVDNVVMDKIDINYVLANGLGIWNCAGGDGFDGHCKNINTSNLIVKSWARKAGIGYAYWGSGVTSSATNVNLTNFLFDNSTYAAHAATGDGRGLHLEHGYNWNHSNGVMENIKRGDGSITTGGIAISISGGYYLNYNNIIIKTCTIGVSSLVSAAQNVRLNNVHITGASYTSYYLAGTRFTLTNCSAVQLLGATSFAFYLESTGGSISDFILDDIFAQVTHATDPTYGISIGGTGTIGNVTIGKFNLIATHGVFVSSHLHRRYIHGIVLPIKIREAVIAGTDYEIPLIVAGGQLGGRISVLNAGISFGAGIAVDATDYNTYTLKKYNAAGGGAADVGVVNTKDNDLSTALVPVIIPIAVADRTLSNLAVGEILTLAKTHTNAGKAEADGILTIEYISY